MLIILRVWTLKVQSVDIMTSFTVKKISLNSVWDHKTESIIRSTMEESAFNYQIIGSSK